MYVAVAVLICLSITVDGSSLNMTVPEPSSNQDSSTQYMLLNGTEKAAIGITSANEEERTKKVDSIPKTVSMKENIIVTTDDADEPSVGGTVEKGIKAKQTNVTSIEIVGNTSPSQPQVGEDEKRNITDEQVSQSSSTSEPQVDGAHNNGPEDTTEAPKEDIKADAGGNTTIENDSQHTASNNVSVVGLSNRKTNDSGGNDSNQVKNAVETTPNIAVAVEVTVHEGTTDNNRYETSGPRPTANPVSNHSTQKDLAEPDGNLDNTHVDAGDYLRATQVDGDYPDSDHIQDGEEVRNNDGQDEPQLNGDLNVPDAGDEYKTLDLEDDDEPSSSFFTFILFTMFATAILYLLYHNRRKVLAYARPSNQRKTGSRFRGKYDRLENQPEDRAYRL